MGARQVDDELKDRDEKVTKKKQLASLFLVL